MSFDFVAAIKNIAPIVAGTFGTPLAGLAVKAICDQIPDAAQKQAVMDAHAADPVNGGVQKIGELFAQGVVNAAQIKQAELQHAQAMAELGYRNVEALESIAAADRANARQREETTRDEMPKILAATIVIMWGLIQWHLINHSVPDDMREIIMRVLGTLDAALTLALSYFFGTTASSRAKDQTIATMAK